MAPEKKGWIDVAELLPRVSVQDIAAYYRFALAETFGTSGEQRMRCPVTSCDGNSDERSVSINLSNDKAPWKCHRKGYGCGAQGDKLTLAYSMKHGNPPPGGSLKGADFRQMAQELLAIAGGAKPSESPDAPLPSSISASEPAKVGNEAKPNTPLTNESLINLDQQLIVDPAEMNPLASRYFRSREWLTDEVCREARCGFMPGRAKSTLRGKWVFGVFDEAGEPLCWVGRNLNYELEAEKSRGGEKEPAKYKFPKLEHFRRRFELYGQEQLSTPENAETLHRLGLIIVEGFNDVLRLRSLGVPSVGLMSNQATDEQIEKLVAFAKQYGDGKANLFLDANAGGDIGAKDALWNLAEAGLAVRTLWSSKSDQGRFSNRETESLTEDEWREFESKLPTTA